MLADLYHACVSRLMSAGLCQRAYVSMFVVRSQQLLEQIRELFENCFVSLHPTDVQVLVHGMSDSAAPC